MRDEVYGISIIGLAASLYGVVAAIGMAHATAVGTIDGSITRNEPATEIQETLPEGVALAANR